VYFSIANCRYLCICVRIFILYTSMYQCMYICRPQISFMRESRVHRLSFMHCKLFRARSNVCKHALTYRYALSSPGAFECQCSAQRCLVKARVVTWMLANCCAKWRVSIHLRVRIRIPIHVHMVSIYTYMYMYTYTYECTYGECLCIYA
jgi:hypothetical protein